MDYTANQASLSMRFSRQEYWGELPFPSPGDLPDPGIEPTSPALAGGFFTTEPPGKQSVQFSSVAELCLTLRPHGLQHTRLPCPTPAPGITQAHVHPVGDAIQYINLIIYQEKEMLKGKMLSEEALKIAVKRREAKGKGKRKDIPI